MRALVTGGSGFLGGHIVQELEKRGLDVTVFDMKAPTYMADAKFVAGDITLKFNYLVEGSFDLIFHAAGSLGTHTTFGRIEQTFSVNVMGMISLLNWVVSTQPQARVINCGLIRDWLNPYMISKHTASKIGMMYNEVLGVKFLDIRMTVVYGPRQGWQEEKAVPRFILQALKSLPFTIYGDGGSLMNMMYVKDVAKVLVDLSQKEELFGVRSPRMMDLANPSGDISVMDLARTVLSKVEPYATTQSRIEYKDMRRGQPGRVDVKYDLTCAYRHICDLGSRFRSLSDGLDETIAWYRYQL
jgi:nucleoside-diphosphate-sugar epimerase